MWPEKVGSNGIQIKVDTKNQNISKMKLN